MKKQKCPAGLQNAGKAFWRKVNEQIVIEEVHDLERLKVACQALDGPRKRDGR